MYKSFLSQDPPTFQSPTTSCRILVLVQNCATWWCLAVILVTFQPVSGPDTDLAHVFCLSGNHRDGWKDCLALAAWVGDVQLLLDPLVDWRVLGLVS